MVKKPEDYMQPDELEEYAPDIIPEKDGSFTINVDIENDEQKAIITFTKPI
jgi:hypothetical protein